MVIATLDRPNYQRETCFAPFWRASRISVDLHLDGYGALLRLKDDQIVIVRDIINGGFEEACARNDAQSDERSHEIDFAIRQTMVKRIVSKRTAAEE